MYWGSAIYYIHTIFITPLLVGPWRSKSSTPLLIFHNLNTASARQAGTLFTYPGGMEGWVDLGGWLHTEMIYLFADGRPSKYCDVITIGPLPTYYAVVHLQLGRYSTCSFKKNWLKVHKGYASCALFWENVLKNVRKVLSESYMCVGDYQVSILFNDQPIPDSPFDVYVAPADATALDITDLDQQVLQVSLSTQGR